MKRLVMLALVVTGVLMINACQDEEIRVKDDSNDFFEVPEETLPDIKANHKGDLPVDTIIE